MSRVGCMGKSTRPLVCRVAFLDFSLERDFERRYANATVA
jgi:hypothetical protein